MYEVISNQKVLYENLCPASIRFYKKLSDDDSSKLMGQVKVVEDKIKEKNVTREVENAIIESWNHPGKDNVTSKSKAANANLRMFSIKSGFKFESA